MRYDQSMSEMHAPKKTGAPYWLVVAAAYVIVAALAVLSISNEFRHIDDTIETLARERGTVLFRLIELTRDWNAMHGGVPTHRSLKKPSPTSTWNTPGATWKLRTASA